MLFFRHRDRFLPELEIMPSKRGLVFPGSELSRRRRPIQRLRAGQPSPPGASTCLHWAPALSWGPAASPQAPSLVRKGRAHTPQGALRGRDSPRAPQLDVGVGSRSVWPSAGVSPLRGGSVCLRARGQWTASWVGAPGQLAGDGAGEPVSSWHRSGAVPWPCCIPAPRLASRISTSFFSLVVPRFRGQPGCCCFRRWVQTFQPGML